MTEPVKFRRARTGDESEVRSLVQTVTDETYGGLWMPPPLPIGDDDWSLSWIAIVASGIAGVVLTNTDRVEDLWVASEHRSRGIGATLLTLAEQEIARRGHSIGRLRVVSTNVGAVRFYTNRGWNPERTYPHEHYPIAMLDLTKPLERPA